MPELKLIDKTAAYMALKHEAETHGLSFSAEAYDRAARIIDQMPTIPDIDRAAILRLCNEIECIVHEIYNTWHMMQNCDYDAIFNRVKKIRKELTRDEIERTD